MGFCKHCKKWVAQPEGRRVKEFCNSTCRSNYWYGLNKKGKSQSKPSKDEFEHEIKYSAPTAQSYDAPKLSKPIQDEPPMFQAKAVERFNPEILMMKYVEERRNLSGQEEYVEWLGRLNSDGRLTSRQKEQVKATN